MRIRTAVPDDVPAIASTLHRAFLEFEPLYTPEAFAATISSPGRIRIRLSEGPILWRLTRSCEEAESGAS